MMKAVILCGGRGTRIRDVSEVLPKPMLSIGDRPMLWHIMKIYSHYGINDFILCLGYKGWVIKEFFLNYYAKILDASVSLKDQESVIYHHDSKERLDWKITMVETGHDSQTGARVLMTKKYLKDSDDFCLTYGDGLADIDINALLDAHKNRKLKGFMTGVHPPGRFGEIQITGNKVSSFAEKPNVSCGLYNGGFMVFKKEVLDEYFRKGSDLVLESGVLPGLVKEKQLGIYEHKGFWHCVDTPRDLDYVNKLWKENKAPWKVW
ncbi:glucose-1-phosphate cytidylyltransferase [Candidatus Omnitrophota bacterium]